MSCNRKWPTGSRPTSRWALLQGMDFYARPILRRTYSPTLVVVRLKQLMSSFVGLFWRHRRLLTSRFSLVVTPLPGYKFTMCGFVTVRLTSTWDFSAWSRSVTLRHGLTSWHTRMTAHFSDLCPNSDLRPCRLHGPTFKRRLRWTLPPCLICINGFSRQLLRKTTLLRFGEIYASELYPVASPALMPAACRHTFCRYTCCVLPENHAAITAALGSQHRPMIPFMPATGSCQSPLEIDRAQHCHLPIEHTPLTHFRAC